MIEWRTVPGISDYEVSSCGQVRSRPRVDWRNRPWPGRVLKPYLTGKLNGQYQTVTINCKHMKVHRLVALAFLPPIEGKTHVNHKDGDRMNNSVTNLEWCTNAENIQHARDVLGTINPPKYAGWRHGGHKGKLGAAHHCSKAIEAFSPTGDVIRFGAAAEAARTLGLSPESVVRAANGVYKSTKGYRFSWVEAA